MVNDLLLYISVNIIYTDQVNSLNLINLSMVTFLQENMQQR